MFQVKKLGNDAAELFAYLRPLISTQNLFSWRQSAHLEASRLVVSGALEAQWP